MINIYYTKFTQQLPPTRFNALVGGLPSSIQKKIRGFIRWQDAQASLFGKLLLVHALQVTKCNHLSLDQLQYTPFGRPYFEGAIDFNISHSGQYVVCAISSSCHLGIDIENICSLDWSIFRDQFTLQEWTTIHTHPDPTQQFYHYWTRKEAVIKADGRGLQLPLQTICTVSNLVELGNKRWHLEELTIDEEYKVSLSSSEKLSLSVQEVLIW